MKRKNHKRLERLLARILVVTMILSLFSGMAVIATDEGGGETPPETPVAVDVTLNFAVTDENGPISGAVVTVNGQTATTDETGAATVTISASESGSAAYTVTKDGYDTASGTASYTPGDLAVSVAVSLIKAAPTEEEVTVTVKSTEGKEFEVVLLELDNDLIEPAASSATVTKPVGSHTAKTVVKIDGAYMYVDTSSDTEKTLMLDVDTASAWANATTAEETVTVDIFSDKVTIENGAVVVDTNGLVATSGEKTVSVSNLPEGATEAAGKITFTKPGNATVVITDLYDDGDTIAECFKKVTTVTLSVVPAQIDGATVAVDVGGIGAASFAVGNPADIIVTYTVGEKTFTESEFLGLVNITLNEDSKASGSFVLKQDATTRNYRITAAGLNADEVSVYLDVEVQNTDFLKGNSFTKCAAPISFNKITTYVAMPSQVVVNRDDFVVQSPVETGLPATTSDGRTITYTAAGVSFDGTTVTALPDEDGDITVTATAAANSAYKAFAHTVTLKINPVAKFAEGYPEYEWLKLSLKESDADNNRTYQNTLNDPAGKTWTYTSSNTDVADVDAKTGVLTVKKAGEVTITATDANNSAITKSYPLTVKPSELAPAFVEDSKTVTAGEQTTIAVPVLEGVPKDVQVAYSIEGTNFSLENGIVTLPTEGIGDATVTATLTDTYGRYSISDTTIEFEIFVKYAVLPAEDLFTTSEANGEKNWYVPGDGKTAAENVVFTAIDGYYISTSDDYAKAWDTQTLTLADFVGDNSEGEKLGEGRFIYIREAGENGAVYKATLPGYQVDNELPTVKVTFTQSVKQVAKEGILYFNKRETKDGGTPLIITLEPEDSCSGVAEVSWSRDGGESYETVSPKDGTYQIDTTKVDDFKSVLRFKVVDEAGLENTTTAAEMGSTTMSAPEVVVDGVSPEITITYDDVNTKVMDGSNKVTALHSNGTITATVKVTEEYFDNNRIHVSVNGGERNTDWTLSWKDNVATIKLNGADNQEMVYSISISGTDRADNAISKATSEYGSFEGNTYTSCDIVVDKIAPVISVTYTDPKRYIAEDENGVKNAVDNDGDNVATAVYADNVTATIKVDETYFNANDYTVKVNGKALTDVNWNSDNEAKIILKKVDTKNETYKLEVTGTDISGTPFVAGKVVQLGSVSDGMYSSKTILIDDTTPTAAVTYGDAITQVDEDEKQVDDVADGKTVVYDGTIEATLVVTEEYFDTDDCTIQVNGASNDGIKTVWDGNTATITIPQKTDSEDYYTITIEGTDMAGHSIKFSEIVHGGVNTKENKYISKELLIDTKAPEVTIKYKPTAKVGAKKGFYTANSADITVTDTSFDNTCETQGYSITGFDANGEPVNVAAVKMADKWAGGNGTWTNAVDFTVEANYTFNFDLKDNAGNPAVITVKNDEGQQNTDIKKDENGKPTGKYTTQFTVDKTAPETFEYSYSSSVTNAAIGGLFLHDYYSAKVPLTLTITATDSISGVQTMEYTYNRTECASKTNQESIEKSYSYDADYKDYKFGEASVKETVTYKGENGQLHGVFDYSVVDYAGNVAPAEEEKAEGRIDDHSIIVVDSISPTATVSYEINGSRKLDEETTYYYIEKDTVSIPLVIEEANFYKEDVKVSLKTEGKYDGKFMPIDNLEWTREEGTDRYTTYINLTEPNSYYYFKVEYMDRSQNKMGLEDKTHGVADTESYTSPRIVLDTIDPVIQVQYSGSSRNTNGKPYYNTTAVATITVTETNFFAGEVQFTMTGKNIDGGDVNNVPAGPDGGVEKGWKSNGNVHTCTITYSADANYTFDVAYSDPATNAAAEYSEDAFCVDKTPPTNLNISYSTDVWGTMGNGILWYDAPVNVVLTCTDITAGIETITYSYPTASGVSHVNVGSGDITVSINAATSNVEYSFSIPSSVLVSTNQFNGTVNFTAVDRSGNATSLNGTNQLVVDNIAPNVTITYSEPVSSDDTTDYYSTAFEAEIEINEANFDASDVTIEVEKDGEVYTNYSYQFVDESEDIHVATIRFTEDGEYVIKISYTDMSKNMLDGERTESGVYTSRIKIVDKTAPEIVIKDMLGTEDPDKIAYDDEEITFNVTFTDDNLLAEDISVELTSFKPMADANDIKTYGYVDEEDLVNTVPAVVTDGEEYSISTNDIIDDAVYLMNCTATDQAGNLTTNNIMFSVNRDGSTYYISDAATNELLEKFWTNEEIPVEIHEISVEALSQTNVTVVRDSTSENLEQNEDYEVTSITGDDNNWNDYAYDVYDTNFAQEGSYTVQTSSVTEVKENGGTQKNYSSADHENAAIRFVMDLTAPEAYISGIVNEGKYDVSEQPITISLADNAALASASLYVDGVETKIPVDENFNGTFETVLAEKNSNQTVEVRAYDKAGNEYGTEPMSVRITSNFFYMNWEIIVVCGVIVLVALAVLIGVTANKKKKHKNVRV